MAPPDPPPANASRKASVTPRELLTRGGPPPAQNDTGKISAIGPPQAVPAPNSQAVTWGLAGHLHLINSGVSRESFSGASGPSSSTAQPNNNNRAPESSRPRTSAATGQTARFSNSGTPIDPCSARPSASQASTTTTGHKQPRQSSPSEAGPSSKRIAVEPKRSSAASSSVPPSTSESRQEMGTANYKGCSCAKLYLKPKRPTVVSSQNRFMINWL